MEKYTKKQRHEIYKKIYNSKSFNRGIYGHLCYELYLVTGTELINEFKELYYLFPENWGGEVLEKYSFDDYSYNGDYRNCKELRKIILEFCIEMTK